MTEATTSPKQEMLKGYTVFQLLASGSRFTDDYDEAAAVDHYMRLHPEADQASVQAELDAEIAKRGG